MLRGLLNFILAGALAFLVLGVQPADPNAAADPVIQRALDDITTANFDPLNPSASFPAGYANVMGYTPVVGIGPDGGAILMKATGECSSFSGATEYRFDAVCKEHDLAYDVLRYSDLVGKPLPGGSREQADDMFDRQLHNQCTYSRLSGPNFALCHTMAESFGLAVKFNSWRQGFKPPALHESELQWLLMAIATALLLLVRRPVSGSDQESSSRINDLRNSDTWLTVPPPGQATPAPDHIPARAIA